MLAATVLAIFYVPLFFVLLRRVFRSKHRPQQDSREAGRGPASAAATASP
jgi:hypothetical protein